MVSDDVMKGMAVAVAVTIPFYVVGYFPPDDKGDKHPPHEHTHLSSGSTVPAAVPAAEFTTSSRAFPGTESRARF